MAKKPKKQQDDQQPEDEVVEIPEDRLGQIGDDKSKDEVEEEAQGEAPTPRELEQDQASEDASEEVSGDPKLSGDDLLADIRRSMADEEEVESEPKGFFGRIRKRLRRSRKSKPEESETPLPEVEAELDTQSDTQEDLPEDFYELVVEQEPKPKSKKKSTRDKEEEKAVQDFFADLKALADVEFEGDSQPTAEVEEVTSDEAQPAEKVTVPKLPVKTEKDEVDFDSVRQLALEEYDETKVELEEKKAPLREEVRRTIRELRPVERMLVIGFGVVTVLVLLSSGVFLIANSISVPTPTPTVVVDVGDIVHPTRLTLPGGWEFNLGQGRVSEGEWKPDGAEWLVGTEISRWVALPWTLQLEAVLRTLNSDDQLELTMSNFDVLTFNVNSIQEISMEELLATDPTTPSLLVVLYNDEEADGTFWVVTALP
jgi:hypothetical protein